ncbi:MAG: hypothetical protein ACKPKO_10095, partial [Candidatus Fonsibacter sp.]
RVHSNGKETDKKEERGNGGGTVRGESREPAQGERDGWREVGLEVCESAGPRPKGEREQGQAK